MASSSAPVLEPKADGRGRTLARLALGAFLVFAGTSHLTWSRQEFQAQVPTWVPVDADTW